MEIESRAALAKLTEKYDCALFPPSLPSFIFHPLCSSPLTPHHPLHPPASTTLSFCITHTLLNNEDEVNPTVTSASQTDFIFTDLLQLHHRPLGIPPTHCAQTLYQAIASAETRLDRRYRTMSSNSVKFSPSLDRDHSYFPCNFTPKHDIEVMGTILLFKYKILFLILIPTKNNKGLSESKVINRDISEHMSAVMDK